VILGKTEHIDADDDNISNIAYLQNNIHILDTTIYLIQELLLKGIQRR